MLFSAQATCGESAKTNVVEPISGTGDPAEQAAPPLELPQLELPQEGEQDQSLQEKETPSDDQKDIEELVVTAERNPSNLGPGHPEIMADIGPPYI